MKARCSLAGLLVSGIIWRFPASDEWFGSCNLTDTLIEAIDENTAVVAGKPSLIGRRKVADELS